MNEQSEAMQRYAVEVSGWDAKEKFFVEATRLEWNDQNHKTVLLKHNVKNGGMVFLRLLDPLKARVKIPVAYRASRIQSLAPGCCEIELDQVWPDRMDTSSGIGDAAAGGNSLVRSACAKESKPTSRIESMIRNSPQASRQHTP